MTRPAAPGAAALFLAGALCPVAFLAGVLVGGWLTPRYSHLANAVSELTQRGATHAAPVEVLFSLSAVLMTVLGFATWRFRGRGDRRLAWAGWLLVGAGLMALALTTVFPQEPIGEPLTFAGLMHLVLVGVSALALVSAILLAGWALDRPGSGRNGWRAFSVATVAVMLLGGASTPVIVLSGLPLLGLAERVTQAAYLLWLFVFAVTSFRQCLGSAPPATDLRPA